MRPGLCMGPAVDLVIKRLIAHQDGSFRRTVDVSEVEPHRRAGLQETSRYVE